MSAHVAKTEEDFNSELQKLIVSKNILMFNSNLIKEGSKIGSGGFGKVIVGRFKSLIFAIKKLREYQPKSLLREIYILKKYFHPYIPLFYGIVKKPFTLNRHMSLGKSLSNYIHDSKILEISESIPDSNNSSQGSDFNILNRRHSEHQKKPSDIDIVIEIIEGETLETIMKSTILTEIEKIIILLDFASVIEYLHEQRIIHRDLKPSNIMIDKKFQFKLLDFGISKVTTQGKESTKTLTVGTMCYMAPENFHVFPDHTTKNEPEKVLDQHEKTDSIANLFTGEITDKVDIWAFGCIVQELISGVKPWGNKVKNEGKILGLLYSKTPFEVTNLIDKESKYRALINKCVVIEPNKRITIREAKKLLLDILFEKMESEVASLSKTGDLAEGILSFYKSFSNVLYVQKFHVLKRLENYIFDCYHLKLTEKNIKLKMLNPKLVQGEDYKKLLKWQSKPKFLHDFYKRVKNKTAKLSFIEKFLEKAKFIEEETKNLKKIFENKKEVLNFIVDPNVRYTKGVSCLKHEDNSFFLQKNQNKYQQKKVKFMIQTRKSDSNLIPTRLHSPTSGISTLETKLMTKNSFEQSHIFPQNLATSQFDFAIDSKIRQVYVIENNLELTINKNKRNVILVPNKVIEFEILKRVLKVSISHPMDFRILKSKAKRFDKSFLKSDNHESFALTRKSFRVLRTETNNIDDEQPKKVSNTMNLYLNQDDGNIYSKRIPSVDNVSFSKNFSSFSLKKKSVEYDIRVLPFLNNNPHSPKRVSRVNTEANNIKVDKKERIEKSFEDHIRKINHDFYKIHTPNISVNEDTAMLKKLGNINLKFPDSFYRKDSPISKKRSNYSMQSSGKHEISTPDSGLRDNRYINFRENSKIVSRSIIKVNVFNEIYNGLNQKNK